MGQGCGFAPSWGITPAQVGPAGAWGKRGAGKAQKLEEGSSNSYWKVTEVSKEERAFGKVWKEVQEESSE